MKIIYELQNSLQNSWVKIMHTAEFAIKTYCAKSHLFAWSSENLTSSTKAHGTQEAMLSCIISCIWYNLNLRCHIAKMVYEEWRSSSFYWRANLDLQKKSVIHMETHWFEVCIWYAVPFCRALFVSGPSIALEIIVGYNL